MKNIVLARGKYYRGKLLLIQERQLGKSRNGRIQKSSPKIYAKQ